MNWSGRFRAPLENLTIYPRPEYSLPIWRAVGGTPSSVLEAARLGMPIIFAIIGGQFPQYSQLINYYKEAYLASGHREENMRIGVHAHCFIANSKEEIEKNYYPRYAAQMDRIGQQRGWPPFSIEKFRAGMSANGALVMGTPQEVTEKVDQMIDLFGLTRFVAHMDVGGPTDAQLKQSIELFGQEVIG